MQLAFCILCHKYDNALVNLVEKMYKEFDLYVHVDKRSDISEFSYLNGKVEFIDKRFSSKWGSFNMIMAMLECLKCTNNKKYDYIFILSGDSYPIKSTKYIKDFINDNSGYEFVGIDKKFNKKELKERLYYNHYFFNYKKQKKFI